MSEYGKKISSMCRAKIAVIYENNKKIAEYEKKIKANPYNAFSTDDARKRVSKLMETNKAIRNSARIELVRMGNAHKESLVKTFTSTPEELSCSDIALFKSGIELNASDLKAVVDRNPENKAIARMATQYARENNICEGGQVLTFPVPGFHEAMEDIDNCNYIARLAIDRSDFQGLPERLLSQIDQ